MEQYKKSLKKNDIYLDEHETLKSIFSKSDIMIADTTSIIPLYFVTGNPVIYCSCDLNLFGIMKDIEPALYVANNWNEVEKYVEMLLSGKDPLREKRRHLIKEIYGLNINASDKIAQAIIDDYNSGKEKYD